MARTDAILKGNIIHQSIISSSLKTGGVAVPEEGEGN
jgi:hypothetical protein